MKSEGEVSAIHPAPKVVKMAKSHFYFAGLLAPLIKTKICTKCKKELPATKEYFYGNPGGKYGLNSDCKVCTCERTKKYRMEHKEEIRIFKKKYSKEHSLELKKYHKQYCIENREKVSKQKKKWQNGHQKQVIERSKRYYRENRDEILKKTKAYRQKHKMHYRNYAKKYFQTHRKEKNEYCRNKRKTNIEYRILCSLRSRLGDAIRSQGAIKSDHTKKLIGCTVKFLIRHIESQFDAKMSWDNYGRKGWHIDHKKPCAAFDLTKPEEQKKCFHYTNLQPLWHDDNFKKNSFYDGVLIKKGDKYADLDYTRI